MSDVSDGITPGASIQGQAACPSTQAPVPQAAAPRNRTEESPRQPGGQAREEIEILDDVIAPSLTVDAEGQLVQANVESLVHSEQRFKIAAELASDLVYEWDMLSGNIEFFADVDSRLGYDMSEFPRTLDAWRAEIHPEDRERVVRAVERSLESRTPFAEEYRVGRKDGTYLHVIDRGHVTWDGQGRGKKWIGVLTDITERKQAERALRESEARHRDLADSLPEIVFEMDLAGRLNFVNGAAYEKLGYVPEDFAQGIWALDFLSPQDRQRGKENIARVLEGKGTRPEEYTFLRKDGSCVPVRIYSRSIIREGRAVGLRGFIVDISAERQSQDALRESEQRHRELADSLPETVFEADLVGRLTFCNRAGFDQFGLTQREFRREIHVVNLVVPEDRDRARSHIAAVLAGRQPPREEYQALREDGTTFPATIHSTRIMREGVPAGLRGLIVDISPRVQAEGALREHVERLRSITAGMIQAMSVVTELRDLYTAGHQKRVSRLARSIAQEMGLSPEEVEGIRVAAVIHDIGKISVPAEILSKPTTLGEFERRIIQTHPEAGYSILEGIDFLWPVGEMVLQHHERLDGSGYPRGLKGEEIVLGARILAVADVVEAMASHRPYRPALGLEYALEQLIRDSGTLYDAEAVRACARLFEERGYRLE